MGIGEVIAAYRIERGLTQRELAELVGATFGAVGHWEAGIRTPPIAKRLLVAEILGIPAEKVLPEITIDPGRIAVVTEPDLLKVITIYRSLLPSERRAIFLATQAYLAALRERPEPEPKQPRRAA